LEFVLLSEPSALPTVPAADRDTPRQAEPLAASQPMVVVETLGKRFRIFPRRWGRLIEWLSVGRINRHQDYWALRNVSFSVCAGESLGVIGVNGSGKSTLLKILSSALYATEGSFQIRGRVLSLLELGTGLNPELTGRQNVLNSASLLGFGDGYADKRMRQIEDFAELGEFFDRPIRLYSSGMLVRLSFSMFACFEPQVFIVDEALSVGDVFFQQKCARRIQEMRQRGTTMLFVSHDLAAVEALCDRVLLLHAGQVRHLGDKKTGIRLYYAMGGGGSAFARTENQTVLASAVRPDSLKIVSPRAIETASIETLEPSAAPMASSQSFGPIDSHALPWQPPDPRDGFGEGSARIDGVCFRRELELHDPVVIQGDWLEIFMRATILRDIGPCNAGLGIYDRHNRLLFACTWINSQIAPMHFKAGQELIARFAIKLDLEPGEYLTSLAISEALRDELSPSGWSYHIGGVRHAELPHAAVIAVLPRPDRTRPNFGPANLQTRMDRAVNEGAPG
jgi:lipopolysaccharide transport system ATP-binding protein